MNYKGKILINYQLDLYNQGNDFPLNPDGILINMRDVAIHDDKYKNFIDCHSAYHFIYDEEHYVAEVRVRKIEDNK